MRPFPEPHEIIVRYVLEHYADRHPDKPCFRFEDGETWNWATALDEGYRAAHALAAAGVERGDHVLIFLPNGPDWVRTWLGITFLGSVMVPINTAFKGTILEHVCRDSGARIAVSDQQLRKRLDDVDVSVTIVSPADLLGDDTSPPALDTPLQPWDVVSIMYTSGTTGPSKGAITTYLHAAMGWWDNWRPRVRPDDTVLVDVPLFHIGAQAPTGAHLSRGATVAIRSVFSATRYWDIVREVGATGALMVGTIAPALAANPPRPDDADNPMRHAMLAPLVADTEGFAKRFGIDDLWLSYGGTEMGCLTVTEGAIPDKSSIGKARPGVELRVVDEHDVPLGPGEVGELIARTDRPWELTLGYWNDPEKTAEAWRNGWYHTGDAVRYDDEGSYYFVDRVKDVVRRRGENISSFEVEREVLTFPGVLETACVAAEAELGEDEVKVFVVPDAGGEVDEAELVRHLVPRLPYFMVPRYVEVVDELPKTPTNKVRKHELRARGNGDRTFDREAAGIVVDRHS